MRVLTKYLYLRAIISSALLSLCFYGELSASPEKHCIAEIETPVLNTPDFESVFGGRDGKTVKTDESGLIRELEFIALPGTVFDIIKVFPREGHDILEIKTAEYSSPKNLYIDSRFIKYSAAAPRPRTKILPNKESTIKTMLSRKAVPTCGAGTYAGG